MQQLPFDPQDFPINEDVVLNPTRIFYLKGAIHFKSTAAVHELTGMVRRPFNDFSNAFLGEVSRAIQKVGDHADYEVQSCGEMMRTIKTMVDKNGEKLCDINIAFVSFDCSTLRFPPGSKHSRHQIEMFPVGDGKSEAGHEGFVKNSIPHFWDLTGGRSGVLYKCLNQQRVEVGKVAAYGFQKDAILVLNGDEVDDVVALATCIVLLNGKDAMDA